MTSDNLPTAELVSSETTGYIDPKTGQFVYGEPPARVEVEREDVYVQTGEDI